MMRIEYRIEDPDIPEHFTVRRDPDTLSLVEFCCYEDRGEEVIERARVVVHPDLVRDLVDALMNVTHDIEQEQEQDSLGVATEGFRLDVEW